MSSDDQRVDLAGSHRSPLPGASAAGAVEPDEEISVTVLLRRRLDGGDPPDPAELGQRSLAGRQHLSREDFAARYGADGGDADQIETFATDHDLRVLERSLARRSVRVSGRAADVARAFGVELQRYRHAEGTHRGHEGPVRLPSSVHGLVQGVFGLDDRPQVRGQYIVYQGDPAAASGFTAVQVGKIYDFPTDLDGTGTCIGILEFGGGYNASDLDRYFSGVGIATPKVTAVSVDGATNAPTGQPDGADAEVALDIEVCGSVAPKASIAVYFAPNTEQGFVDAVTTALHDTTNRPVVLSISWGGPESTWSAQGLQSLDQAIGDAAALGVTVCVAAGDSGSGDGVGDGKAHVDFPASSPNSLGCGGTHLTASGTTISSETVWNDGASGGGATGGGVSDQFALPSWQSAAKVPPSVNAGHVGRGVPDVAGDGSPSTGYNIYYDGQAELVGGTSAVAPLWSGLVSLLAQHLGKGVGFLNPLIYAQLPGTAAFHDITSGNNAVSGAQGYSAGPGWDACSGWGSPNGAQLIELLKD
ncbi:MAG TPA: S53 family peptidase [Candidatus Dormibacteraeota bacterium]|jgi:kumamolisin|nr:S53 family peptidase [Candidatus Dormibacteraeota bacterium]